MRTGVSAVTMTSVQPRPGCTMPRSSVTVASARTTVVPMAITRPPFCRVAPMAVGGRPRDAVALGVRALLALERRHAGVQHERRDADPPSDQVGDQLGGEGARRARHLDAAGLAREHGLVGLDRPFARHVAVADRTAVRVEEVEHRRVVVEGRGGEPQPLRVGESGVQLHASEPEQVDARPARRRPAARSCPSVGWRTSTRSTPPGSSPEKCTTTGSPSGRRASTAAGTVAEVFTTTRSPGRRNSPSASKRACTGAASPSLTSSRTWSRRRPRLRAAGALRARGRARSRASVPTASGGVRRLDHGYLDPAATKALAS